ncbi:Uncharacterised protein [Streptococcus pneumoniae]|nr:Uncharacterised protein [Streptococcus pneumoniae]
MHSSYTRIGFQDCLPYSNHNTLGSSLRRVYLGNRLSRPPHFDLLGEWRVQTQQIEFGGKLFHGNHLGSY